MKVLVCVVAAVDGEIFSFELFHSTITAQISEDNVNFPFFPFALSMAFNMKKFKEEVFTFIVLN